MDNHYSNNLRKNHFAIFWSVLIIIVLLFLNDHYWKYQYANELTGKLSDFLGLLALPVFLSTLFPTWKKVWPFVVGSCFVVWKTPLVSPLITFFNESTGITVARTIDYTDYFALPVLIIAFFLIEKVDIRQFRKDIQFKLGPWGSNLVLAFSLLVFSATSVEEPEYPEGDILINESISVGLAEDAVLDTLAKKGLEITIDSVRYSMHGISTDRKYYQIKALPLLNKQGQPDTCYNVNFDIYSVNYESECTIILINTSVKDEWQLQDWRISKKQTELYEQLIKNRFIDLLGKEAVE